MLLWWSSLFTCSSTPFYYSILLSCSYALLSATLLYSLVLCSHLPSCSLFFIFCCYVLLYSLLLCSAPLQHALHYGNLFIPLRVSFSLLPCFSAPTLALLFFYTYSTPIRVCPALLLLYSPAPLLFSTPMLTLPYFFVAMFYSTPCCSALLPCCMLCHFGPQRLCSAPLLHALPLWSPEALLGSPAACSATLVPRGSARLPCCMLCHFGLLRVCSPPLVLYSCPCSSALLYYPGGLLGSS
jgi:hypothetical protein